MITLRYALLCLVILSFSDAAQARDIYFSDEVNESSVSHLLPQMNSAAQAGDSSITVYFDSDGGRLNVALNAFNELRNFNFHAVAPQNCSSACTVLFAAGTRRSAGGSAQFTFHGVKVEMNQSGQSDDEIAQIFAARWLGVIRSVAPSLADDLERHHILIDGEDTLNGFELEASGYVND